MVFWLVLVDLKLTGNAKAHLVGKNRAEKRDKQAKNWSLFGHIKKNVS